MLLLLKHPKDEQMKMLLLLKHPLKVDHGDAL
jgi:hypothetical protein